MTGSHFRKSGSTVKIDTARGVRSGRPLGSPARSRPSDAVVNAAVSTEVRKTLQIVNKLGLHARAAAKLVDLASGFESSIRIRRDGREADAKSIMKVMMLAASKGTRIEVLARGDDAAEAAEAIARLVAGRFDEPE